MAPLTGPVLAAALLLVVSGAVKLVRPAATAQALSGLGLMRTARPAARVVGAVEVVVGGWTGITGSAAACLATALVYAAFTAFLVAGLRAPDRISTCGCTGSIDSPPTVAHALVTGALALVGLAAAVTGGVTAVTRTVLVTGVAEGVTVLGYAVVVAALAWAVMALLPRVRGDR